MKLFGIKEYLLPPPSKIWSEFLKRHPTVFAAAWVTTTEIIGGYLLAVVVSIPLALAVVRWRFVEESVYPLVVFLQIIPKIAIAPLFIIWFGFGLFPKLLIVFLLCFFPIVVASVAGFKAVDPDVMDFARSTGASGMRMFLKIRLPQALPDIFTGSRSAPRSRRRPPWWPSSWPPTGASATCSSNTTASLRRRWSSPSSCC